MPGAMHRMGVYLGLVEDDEYADGDGYVQTAERPSSRRDDYDREHYSGAAHHEQYAERRHAAEVTPYAREYSHDDDTTAYAEEYPVQPTYQITALHPRTYNEARTIGEHFRKSTPVIMNLSEMDDADAKRLVDFAAGLTFGLHGRIERVTAKVFLLSPHNVSVTAQDKARIENGFFNQS
ncbi:cell division protein SepF [Jatrophihabitans endophyticus]|uniref:cell division protein SepF n=1 Tax=Jatrophihabitans endophyticus TaxID=1206085 RepID=UPI001A076BE5|nr:cell division protein SepF [Jatrophihabitans endophyticus]